MSPQERVENQGGSYEQKVAKLDEILRCLDKSETPIDELAESVRTGVRIIKELDQKLKAVEMQVKDAFRELEGQGNQDPADGLSNF